MGSQPMKDRQSPSASSTFLIPQLRQSRRGSLTSLSSTSQLDKEALSQALDQIHSSASQTGTLTTFNEYTTPPSSSSDPDSKGITSELHGGLSGLYTRFRASVGNVKDIVQLGSEEPVVETVSSVSHKNNPKGPASSTKSLGQAGPDASSSATTLRDNSTSSLGQHSVGATVDVETLSNEAVRQVKSSKISLGSLSSKSTSGSFGILKSVPPTTLTQAAQTSTISPALAEVNISAVKRGSISTDPPPHPVSNLPVDHDQTDGKAKAPNGLQIHTSNRASNASAVTPSDALLSSTSIRSNGDQQTAKSDFNRVKSSAPSLYEATSERIREKADRRQSEDHVQPFPGLKADGYDKDAYAVNEASSGTDDGRVAPPRIVTSYSRGQDDFFENSERGQERAKVQMKQGGYQHLALPLRKTMAPPMVSRTDSTNPKLSRASSYETNTDNMTDAVPRSSPNTEFGEDSQAAKGKIINPRYPDPSASHQDLRTMNVFSQVKNKVLNKEYWMKDENARDCFYCGDSFTMVRRKHHCRKLATKRYE